MGLYERLLGTELPRIPVHTFSSAMSEFERGKMSQAQVVAAFVLTTGEETEVATLLARLIETPEAYPMGAFVTLTNVGTVYDTTGQSKGLGFTALNVDGITQVTLRVRYNKIGTGVLRWQLFNETNAQELGFVDDAVSGDNKSVDIVVTPGSPLSGGTKLLRPRVQSTVATDDPVYYGSCLFVRRVDRLTAEDLHQVLLLADQQVFPYNTVAAIKTRLGV